MKSIIICEGGTDAVLIQYFMRKVNSWDHIKNKQLKLTGAFKSGS